MISVSIPMMDFQAIGLVPYVTADGEEQMKKADSSF